jgi:hypothetical protein
MLVNIIGNFTFEQRDNDLFIGTEESAALVADGQARLVPPEATYVKFRTQGVTARERYADDITTIDHGGRQWSSTDLLRGGTEGYGVWRTEDADGKPTRMVRDWDGNPIATLPNLFGPGHFASKAMVFTNDDNAHVYSPQGALIASFVLKGRGAGIQPLAHFAEQQAFLRTDSEAAAYQVFDLQRLEVIATLRVAHAIFATCSLAGGSILLVDAEGLQRWDPGSPDGLHLLHRFATALDANEVKMLLWHDGQRAYISIDHDHERDRHTLLALPLAGSQGATPVQELHWSSAWATTIHGGFLAGHNYLSLKRKTLLADNAVLVWAPGEPLSPALFEPGADTAVVGVEQVRSATKGKHGYRVRVEDSDSNRAVRLAALELGRLIGETCRGAYVLTDGAVDRKFDGAFQVEIACACEPTDFEHGFLPAYLGYFRDVGQASPAGSKAHLSLAVTWNGEALTP